MKKLVEGLAKCLDSAGIEKKIKKGEVVYIKEISNMPGHCVVIKTGKLPIVGYHLDRFRLLSKDEV